MFIRTNPFAINCPQFANEFIVDLPHPTAFTPELLKRARADLRAICREDYHYHKADVSLSRITPFNLVQPDLFAEASLHEHYRQAKLMAVVDAINHIFGRGTFRVRRSGLCTQLAYAARNELV